MTITMTKKVSACDAETVQFMSIEKVENEEPDNYSSSKLLRRGKKLEDNNNLSKEDEEYINYRKLLKYEQAPAYLQHNPFIRDGYRKLLPTRLCWERPRKIGQKTYCIMLMTITLRLCYCNTMHTYGPWLYLFTCGKCELLPCDHYAGMNDIKNSLTTVFWWTNETMNIWTHIFGFCLLFILTINDLAIINIHATIPDKIVAGLLFSCFLICLALSSLYHTFSCHSECTYNTFLMYDLFGIALSLLAIYTSGVYYAFWCHYELRLFYMTSVTLIFIAAMVLQIPKLQVPYPVKMCVFIGWAAYGVLPTMHWVYAMGGFDNPMVQIFFPRVMGMYAISGTAFIIYTFKVPERWFPGKVDYIGHSHQWWHLLVLGALYYWHNSGMMYVQYRMNHGCANTMRIF